MKKIFSLILIGGLLMSINSMALSEKYRISDESVEAVFSASTLLVSNSVESSFGVSSTDAVMKDKDPLVAILLDFFLGGLAIHRVYLGGKTSLVLIYFITCGGIFGVVPIIDLIVLAINYDDISQFVGNDKFFMW